MLLCPCTGHSVRHVLSRSNVGCPDLPSCCHTADSCVLRPGCACAEADSALAASTLKCLEGWFKLDWMCEPEGARYGSPGGVRQTQVGLAVQGVTSDPSLHNSDPVPPPFAGVGMCSFM